MRRNPLYNSDTEEDENIQRLSSIYTIDDDLEQVKPEIDNEKFPKPIPDKAWYMMPWAKPEDEASTSQAETSDYMMHTLVQVPGPGGASFGRKMYFETVDKKPDDGHHEMYVFEKPEDELDDESFDPEKALYLLPTYQPNSLVTSQPLSSDKLAHTLVNIPDPSGRELDGKLYFESVTANTDDGPRIVYVLEPPGREEPPPVYTKPLREPRPQLIDRNKHHFWDKREGPAEREFTAEEIMEASPNKFKILKRVASVVFIILELVSECITLSDMYLQKEIAKELSNAADTINQGKEMGSLDCDPSNATKNLTTAYTVFVVLQWLFSIIRVMNIVGETIEDVRGNGFQILHGWDESALGLMMIDIPETTILIAFINQCQKEPTAKLFIYIVSCFFRNVGRKFTTRQKPNVNKEVKIPFICYSFVLIDSDGNFSFSFKKEQWQIKFPIPIFCWNVIFCRDEGCCSDDRECCITDALPWKCCTLYVCCIKIKLCHGIGCKECHCCGLGCGNCCPFCFKWIVAILSIVVDIIKVVVIIIVWCLKIISMAFVHILKRIASPNRFKPVTSDNLDVEKAHLILNIIQIAIFIIGYFIKQIVNIEVDSLFSINSNAWGIYIKPYLNLNIN